VSGAAEPLRRFPEAGSLHGRDDSGIMPVSSDPALMRLDDALRRAAELTRGRTASGFSHMAADDIVGTIATDDAIGFDPRPLLRAMHRCRAPVVVIGQVAGIMHGSGELTGDLDLLWDGDERQAGAMAAAFRSAGARLADDEGAAIACDARAFRLPKLVFSTPSASGDCCTPALPWGDLPIAEFLARHLVVADDGLEVSYLRREDLIRMRRTAGRPKDLRRARELEGLPGPTPR
jgi:hypothetical protein